MSRALLDAFRLADTPPCDKFSCSQRNRCSDDELACSAFDFYVNTGEVLHPYMRIRTAPSGKGRPTMRMGEQAEPTRAIYERLFSE